MADAEDAATPDGDAGTTTTTEGTMEKHRDQPSGGDFAEGGTGSEQRWQPPTPERRAAIW